MTKAEGLDPAFAEAFAADARTTVYVWREAFNDIIQSAPARKRAYEKASRALELDPDLSSPYAILGVMQVVNRRYEDAIASAQRAVAIGPGDAEAQAALGYVQLYAGNHADAATAFETALRLDPDLSAIDREAAGLVFLLQGNVEKAIETLERTHDDAPTVGNFRFTLAAAYVRGGRLADAKAAIADGLRLGAGSSYLDCLAGWQIVHAHFRNPQDLAMIVDALRQAGLPQWPYGFTADEHNRLKGAEIASLVIGHTLQGQIEPGLQPASFRSGATAKRLSARRRGCSPRPSTSMGISCASRARTCSGAPIAVPSTDARTLPMQATPMPIQARCFTSRWFSRGTRLSHSRHGQD